MMMMQSTVRRERALLLCRLYTLLACDRASASHTAVMNSQSLQTLALVAGYGSTNGDFSSLLRKPLPFALVRLIFEYMPLPRLWSFELRRLKKRISIDALDAAVGGAMQVMDEVLTDLQLPCDPRLAPCEIPLSSGWLIRIARNTELQSSLRSGPRPIPADLLYALVREHDLQSVLLRRKGAISCVANVAEQLVSLSHDLCAWYRWHECPGLFSSPHDSHSEAQREGVSDSCDADDDGIARDRGGDVNDPSLL